MPDSTYFSTSLMVKALEVASVAVVPNSTTTQIHRSPAAVHLHSQTLVDFAAAALKLIQDYDVAWHTAVFDESIVYSEADREGLLDLYRTWYAAASNLLSNPDLAATTASGLVSLRANHAEVASLLTPDDEFFEGEELDQLVEQAISELAQGQTVEMKEMGD